MPDDSQVESDIENKLTAELVAEKIAVLPDIYRDIMVLKYLHELNDKEIASTLGISEAAARKRLQRARERLKKLIGGNKNG
jgi:RNA polymerase sigma-70 factor (ECF subfamily)